MLTPSDQILYSVVEHAAKNEIWPAPKAVSTVEIAGAVATIV
jgi:hypothetical protein